MTTATVRRRTQQPPPERDLSPRDNAGSHAGVQVTEVVLPGIGEPESLILRTRQLPELRPGQALVRVEASGVSFAEQAMRRGRYYGQPPFPFTPGYDLVGVVEQSTDALLPVGQRVAALTRTGGWASRLILRAGDLVPVPDGVDPVLAEAVVVNGVTAWRMLHRYARVSAGQTIVVMGANSGVGSLLVQMARRDGIRVIGTAARPHHGWLREMGVTPIDRHSADVPNQVRALAPEGVAAVFDNVGGPGILDSWGMLAPGGTLVGYATVSTIYHDGNPLVPFFKLIARLALWNALPNGRHASFFDVWAGHGRNPTRYRQQLRSDLTAVFALVAQGIVTPRIDRTFKLADAAGALRYVETTSTAGKVILIP